MRYLSLSLPNPDPSADPIKVLGPSGVPTTSDVIRNIPQFLVTVVFLLGMVLAIVFIILSGIQWILSGGDEKKIEAARNRLTYSILGLAIVLAAGWIVAMVFYLIGLNPALFNVPGITSPSTRSGPTVQEQFDERVQHDDTDLKVDNSNCRVILGFRVCRGR